MSRLILVLASIAVVVTEFVVAQDDLFNSGSKAFSTKFFTEMIWERPDKTFIASSYSVLEPLCQLAVGAQGSTAAELYSALGVPGIEALKKLYPAEKKKLSSVRGVELKLISRIFINSNFELSSDYKAAMQTIFEAQPQSIDVSYPDIAANTINAWVESKTNNRIKDLMKPSSIDALTRLILVNAAFFKGNWTHKFDIKNTKNEPFYGFKETKNLPMMHQTATFMFRKDAATGYKFIELPYEGGDASLQIMLPPKTENLDEFRRNHRRADVVGKLFEGLTLTSVRVALPKFSIKTEIDLQKVLSKIGVKEIFSSSANLTKILSGQQQVSVTEAKQKASIDINESGSEVAVANDAILAITMVNGLPSADFIADHPFAFFLKIKNTTMFEGIYVG